MDQYVNNLDITYNCHVFTYVYIGIYNSSVNYGIVANENVVSNLKWKKGDTENRKL